MRRRQRHIESEAEKNDTCSISPIVRAGSSLGSARNLAREPGVFKSSARLGSIFGELGESSM